jgi:hypothetical protein
LLRQAGPGERFQLRHICLRVLQALFHPEPGGAVVVRDLPDLPHVLVGFLEEVQKGGSTVLGAVMLGELLRDLVGGGRSV